MMFHHNFLDCPVVFRWPDHDKGTGDHVPPLAGWFISYFRIVGRSFREVFVDGLELFCALSSVFLSDGVSANKHYTNGFSISVPEHYTDV